MRIFHVEGNEDNIHVLENRRKRYGHEVLIARDGAIGVELATTERPLSCPGCLTRSPRVPPAGTRARPVRYLLHACRSAMTC